MTTLPPSGEPRALPATFSGVPLCWLRLVASSPTAPAAIRPIIVSSGRSEPNNPPMRRTFLLLAAAAKRLSASSRFRAAGCATRTCLPAFSAWSVARVRAPSEERMSTASTVSSSRSSARDLYARVRLAFASCFARRPGPAQIPETEEPSFPSHARSGPSTS